MTDRNRKTIVEKPESAGLRTTVIGEKAGEVSQTQPSRQTVLESKTAMPTDKRRATVVEPQDPIKRPTSSPEQLSPQVFRSVVRPPMALLTALDDGRSDDGEIWRLRQSRTTIGRGDCDIRIPHDPDMSGAHAEILRNEQGGGHQWQLVDLNSTNGVFVRVNRVILRSGREILLGGRRLVFRCQDTIDAAEKTESNESRSTQKQAAPRPGQLLKLGGRLVEQTAGDFGSEYSLTGPKMLLGNDAEKCDICLNDSFLNDIHAQLFQDKQQRWVIRDRDSLNGVWVRVPNKLLDPGTEFLLGGQRFRFDTL